MRTPLAFASILFFLAGSLGALPAFADQLQMQSQSVIPDLNVGLPIGNVSGMSIGGYIAQMYKVGVGVAVILGFLMIFAGGYAWMVGQPAKAKEWIKNAIIGMTIALGSYTILFAINPNLVNLSEPGLATIGSEIEFKLDKTPATQMAVKADCGPICEEEARRRNMSHIGTRGESCTPGTVDTTSGSAGYTKVCVEKNGAICNCELLPVTAGTPNCGANNCVDTANKLYCEPTTNRCANRKGKDAPCRSPLVDRECAEGLECKQVGGSYKCTEISQGNTPGYCCYHTVVGNNATRGTYTYAVKAVSGAMTKQACQQQRPNFTSATIGNLGVQYWIFCPGQTNGDFCGEQMKPFTQTGIAPVPADSDSSKWKNLIGATSRASGCTLYQDFGGGTKEVGN